MQKSVQVHLGSAFICIIFLTFLEVVEVPTLHGDLFPNKKSAEVVLKEELIPYAFIDTLASKCECCSWHTNDVNGLICENEHQTTDF